MAQAGTQHRGATTAQPGRRQHLRLRGEGRRLARSRSEMALFRNLFVELRIGLCGVPSYASAQILALLDLAKNDSFLNRERVSGGPRWKLLTKEINLPR